MQLSKIKQYCQPHQKDFFLILDHRYPIMLMNKLAIATTSLGQHPSHALEHKITVAARAGYQGIEVVLSD
jgi:hypothetical protein